MTITSPQNEHLTQIRKLAGRKWRDKLRLFVAEGEDLIEAAARAGWEPEAVYVAEGSGLDGVPVAPHVLAGVSQLGSGTRALGVFGQRWAPAPVGPACLALWGVNDPGNVGTALRSALAFGAGQRRARPRHRRPVRPEGRPRLHGRALRGPGRAREGRQRAPRPQDRPGRPARGQILQSSRSMLECKI